MDSPVADDGRQLVSDEYLDLLLQLGNDKFAKNQAKTDALYALMRCMAPRPCVIPPCSHAPCRHALSLPPFAPKA